MSDTCLEKILLFDDDSDYRNLLKDYLGKLLPNVELIEHDPVASGMPDEKFDWSSFDVLVLDYYLCIHNFTGLDLLHKYHKNPNFPATIMLTGAGNEEVAIHALDFGIYEYLNKGSLTKEKLKQSIIEAWEAHKINRNNKNEVGKFKRAFNKEIFYQNLEQPAASDDKGHNRILIIIKVDNAGTLKENLGQIGHANLIHHIALNSFGVFVAGKCDPYITRVGDTSVALQVDQPPSQKTLDFNMQGLCSHLSKHSFRIGDKRCKYTVSIGVVKICKSDVSATDYIDMANTAVKQAEQTEGNSYYFWSDTDNLPEDINVDEDIDELSVKESISSDEANITAEAKEKLEAETKAAAEAKVTAEAELKAALEAKGKLEADARVAEEAKVTAEAELKAALEAKGKLEADARVAEEAKAATEAELKAKTEAEVKAATEAKEKLEAETKAAAEAKVTAEAELKAALEAKEKLEIEAREATEVEAKAEAETKAKAEAEELKTTTETILKRKTKTIDTDKVEVDLEVKAETKNKAEVKSESEEETNLQKEEIVSSEKNSELKIKNAIDENRFVQTFQPIVPMFTIEEENQKELYKVAFKLVDTDGSVIDEDELLKQIKSLDLKKYIDQWMMRQILGRVASNEMTRNRYLFLITFSEAWFSDITLFNWLLKMLNETKEIQLGRSIILEMENSLLEVYVKRAAPLISSLKKAHGFNVALSGIISIDNIFPLFKQTHFNMLILNQDEIKELNELTIPEENKEKSCSLVRYLKEKGVRIITKDIEDYTSLSKAIDADTDYAMGEFIGETQDSFISKIDIESFELF